MTMIDSLVEANCENIEPLRSVSDMYQRTRKMKLLLMIFPTSYLQMSLAKNAEFAKEVKCFIVPKWLNKNMSDLIKLSITEALKALKTKNLQC